MQRFGLVPADDDVAGEPEPPSIEVMPCNWWTVQTYLNCEWTLLPLSNGAAVRVLHTGIAAVEIAAVLDLLDVCDPRRRRRVLRGIRLMVPAGAEVRNAQ